MPSSCLLEVSVSLFNLASCSLFYSDNPSHQPLTPYLNLSPPVPSPLTLKGAGLIAGVALAVKTLRPSCLVIGVEPVCSAKLCVFILITDLHLPPISTLPFSLNKH
jgi:hypothetical protein